MSYPKRFIASAARGVSSTEFGFSEQNDCVIRAFCNVTDVPYLEAFDMFKRAGRVNGSGTSATIFGPIFKQYAITPKAAFGTTNAAMYYSQFFKIPRLRGCALESMIRSGVLDNGKFIVAVRGHVFAVIDNEIIDKGVNAAELSVAAVFQLEE